MPVRKEHTPASTRSTSSSTVPSPAGANSPFNSLSTAYQPIRSWSISNNPVQSELPLAPLVEQREIESQSYRRAQIAEQAAVAFHLRLIAALLFIEESS